LAAGLSLAAVDKAAGTESRRLSAHQAAQPLGQIVETSVIKVFLKKTKKLHRFLKRCVNESYPIIACSG